MLPYTEQDDLVPIRDPYRFRVQVGDIVRLPDRRVAVVTQVYKVGDWLPAVRIHIIAATWRERLIRHLAGTNVYLDTDINDLTFVA